MKSFASLILWFVLPVALSPALSAQYGRGIGGRGIGSGGNNSGPVIEAVASFDGVFKTADKKFIEIQVDSGDIVRMYLTHGTKFIRDGKQVKVSDFHDGDKVIADASRDARLNLLAVKIEAKLETKPDGKAETKSEPKN